MNSSSSTSRTYVVTTSVNGSSSSRVWDSSAPLPLGHPVHWIVETTAKGVRVRPLTGQLGLVKATDCPEVSFEALEKGTEIKLPKFSLRIRRALSVAPAYEARTGKTLKIFACAGNWVMDSATLDSNYVGRVQNRKVFTLAKAGNQFQLKAEADDVKLATRAVAFGETVSVGSAELADLSIHWGSYQWRFGLADAPAISDRAKQVDAETVVFRKSIGGASAMLALLLALSWFWPKTDPSKEELVPPQFTKIVMTKPKASAAAESAPAAVTKAPQAIQKTAVVQAFRAKALQNSMSALLKGGMTQLLAQSDLISGKNSAASVGQLFNGKSDALRATAPNTGLAEGKNVAVNTIGGGGVAGSKGYGKGDKAGVKGQGEAFVSMDIAGSSVEEGLTKDEVGEVIHRHMSEVRYCYESAMLRTPDVEGKLIIDFVIGGNGMVKSSEVKTSTLPDPRLDDCVLRRLATWKFPNPKGGVDVAVSYPFIFKSLGR